MTSTRLPGQTLDLGADWVSKPADFPYFALEKTIVCPVFKPFRNGE